MGDTVLRPPTRSLLECDSTDQLCIVRTYEYEVIVVPTFLIGVFVILLAIIFFLRYRKRKSGKGQTQDPQSQKNHRNLNSGISLGELSLDRALKLQDSSLQDLEVPWENIRKPLQLVGEGRFGPIYRTVLSEADGREQDIIIKQLRDSAGPREVQTFLYRIRFQAWLGRHPYLVGLLGCHSMQKPYCMVLESLEPGSLLQFLWDCRRDVMSMDGILYDLTECQVYTIGLQIVSALEFLNHRSLLHGDVATRNILIQRNFTVKLAGLGGACDMHLLGSFPSRRPAPLKWMAPERLLHLPITTKSDVWSFGILLYEMITLGAPPYPEVPASSILQYLQRGNVMKRPSSCKPALYNIMKACWAWKARDRLSISDLQRRLEVGKKSSDDRTVLLVPELVVPELYAGVAGTEALKMETDYTVL
ncbi:tyrosine-protein kinase STYK1 [Bombina bombina]|uniref:tyrosine-protein kinase STYK1 n=1 Tax=Bombina bombina TaxID=8345 RepID=UPI00235ACA3D|nr:tyrosine-protein kinase STYK1 [Bombina bombina]